MAEAIKKYSIVRFTDGRLLLKTIEEDNGGLWLSRRAMTMPEIKELIQDLLKCLRPGASIARAQNKR